MPTVNNNFSSLITAIDTKAQSLAASTTNPKDLVFLGKTLEALNITGTVADVIAQGDTQVAAVNAAGATQVAAVAAQGSGYASLANPTFTGTMNADNLTMSGNLTVNGTQTVLNTATLTVDDLNITVADGAADAAAANGAGLTVDGASATLTYASATDNWNFNKGLDVNGVSELDGIFETVGIGTTTTGTQNFSAKTVGVIYITANATTNRTINFRGDGSTTLDSMMDIGQSFSCAALFAQGSSAYYLNAFQIDGSSVTPLWQGGSAPTAGNASGIDAYSFTIIKTGGATFKLLASVVQFA